MTAPAAPSPHPGMGFKQFTALVALMMALNALAVDSMLPALPAIGETLKIPTENARQWIITAYILGFGSAQLLYGVLGDRFGRRPILLIAIGLYVISSSLAAFAPTFHLMIAARILMGVGAAATRVLSVAVVRDCYAGRTMAKVMSLVFIVFLAVPMAAPSMGAAVIAFLHWRWIFGVLALFGAVILTWASLRLPETLHEEDRLPIQVGRIGRAFGVFLSNRQSVGYTLALTCSFGGLLSFVTSAQQIFFDIFHVEKAFPLIFAAIAAGMGVASLFNSRFVERLGMRRVSHAAILMLVCLTSAHAIFATMGIETVWTFSLFQAAVMVCVGLMGSNFGALSMEPMGHIAGVAASIQGTISTIGAALIGFAVGQRFNGTTAPFAVGVAIAACAILVVVLVVEKGRLFQAGHPMDAQPKPRA